MDSLWGLDAQLLRKIATAWLIITNERISRHRLRRHLTTRGWFPGTVLPDKYCKKSGRRWSELLRRGLCILSGASKGNPDEKENNNRERNVSVFY